MNPNDPTNQPQPNQPQDAQGELFAPRFNIPPRVDGKSPQPPVSSQPWQPPIDAATPHTGTAFPWNSTPAAQPHPAQPASPASNERYQLPLPPASPGAPAGNLPQYGGQMAELPPLNSMAAPENTTGKKTPRTQKSLMKLLFGGLIALAFLAFIGAAILVVVESSGKQKGTANQTYTIKYNTDQVKKLAANNKPLSTAQLKGLNAADTFYSAFRTASQQPVVHTAWDVFYTKNQKDDRADQYSLYGVTLDYRNKQFAYDEDDYSNIGIIQYRCIGEKQYIFDGSKLSDASAAWQPASDSSSCALDSVAIRTNDGMNTGNLSATQSNAFVQQLNKSGAVKVNGMQLVTQKNAQYIKVSVNVTPQKQGSGVYWGMQNFMEAFNATGLNATKQPYTYFGASGEGASLDYYINPATMLPAYSVATSTPAYNAGGNPVTPKTWSHKFIEYQFPGTVAAQNLNDHSLVAFTTWADH